MTLFVRTRRNREVESANTFFVPDPQKQADMCQPHRILRTKEVVDRDYPLKVHPYLSTGTKEVSLRSIPVRSS